MCSNLTLGSLFDGSGGFPLGGLISGIMPVWASEIEAFAVRVTTKRLPFMKHYGDVSALSGADLEPVDIITFGSPCQDMSVAGRRAGLDGSRSNLFYEAVRIAKEMREATDGRYPTWLCWENVPGAFSSNGGRDFKAVLDEIRKIKDPEADTPRPAKWPNAGCILADDHSIAWRVFDAQYWGVPQRRKRIYNLKNVHAAILTKGDDGTFTYDTPEPIPGAVSLSLDAEGDSSPFYADGIVYFRTTANNGYSGDLEIALIPEWFRTEILQEEKDGNGVLIERSDTTESVYFALLFEFDGDVNAIRHVLYNCTASRPSIESKTKEESIEPGTETLSLTADPREDGLVKSRTGDDTSAATYNNWYRSVYEPDANAGVYTPDGDEDEPT